MTGENISYTVANGLELCCFCRIFLFPFKAIPGEMSLRLDQMYTTRTNPWCDICSTTTSVSSRLGAPLSPTTSRAVSPTSPHASSTGNETCLLDIVRRRRNEIRYCTLHISAAAMAHRPSLCSWHDICAALPPLPR